jgi:hypothetical protein
LSHVVDAAHYPTLRWCSGNRRFMHRGSFTIQDGSELTWSFCSPQREDIATLETARLHTDAGAVRWISMCTSRPDCNQRSIVRTVVNDLHCISGTTPHLPAGIVTELSLLDAGDVELASFCA